MPHFDKVHLQPWHLDRIQRSRRLQKKYLAVTDQPGAPVLPSVVEEFVRDGICPRTCPECGAEIEVVWWSIGRFPPMQVFGARCPRAVLEGADA
jgi:hypothetical protein